ncbi:MAG: serine/threonine-protein kinase [Planctomycetota bacterium]
MTPEQKQEQRAYELFEQVLERTPNERAAFLADACGSDAGLRAEVESLLEHDSRTADGFLLPHEPARGSDSQAATGPPDPLIGSHVGSFHIKQVIASGGMGTVYEAVQEHPHRTVALKVMHRNIASRSALRRFQFEAQILGRLRHPNIAQVYQAGMHTPSPSQGEGWGEGQAEPVPYFAMEYIPAAKPITRYAKEKGLNTADRLELFAKACDAVHHGHQKGIIHRDLKPANILVDSAGEPKVIDFGVARATDSDLSLTTQQTCIGQLVGTVQYMSPEQCDADPQDLDTRSDVYSLGVVLYELLTGELPYQASGTTIYAATRAIKEQMPRRPSSINRRLRGDVETITLKALEKDRDRRYQSAAELAQDLHRHLNREPIMARRPTGWTGAVHWVARNPVSTTAVACLGIGVIVTAGVVIAARYYSALPVDTRPAQLDFPIDPFAAYGPHGDYGPEARLLTGNGTLLKTWAPKAGLRFAQLVNRPNELGGGQLVLLGCTNARTSLFPGSLSALDAAGDLVRPAWRRSVETEDVLPELRSFRGATGEQFTFCGGWVFDVFPKHPGNEIVVWFSRWYYSQSAIRIYDLRGELIYQVWHDGTAYSCFWMSDAGLLVFAGNCHWPYWDRDGNLLGTKTHDFVVFALRPELGFIADRYLDYLSCKPGDERLDPVWYLRLRPDNEPDLMRWFTLEAPFPPNDTGRSVAFSLAVNPRIGGIIAVINERGEELADQRIVGQGYKRNQNLADDNPDKLKLPDPDEFKLVPMILSDVLPGSAYAPADAETARP